MKKIFVFVILYSYCWTTLVQGQILPHSEIPKRIALTFDACMTNSMLKKVENGSEKALFNEAIIEYLHQEKIPATIFITGLWAEKYPDAVKKNCPGYTL